MTLGTFNIAFALVRIYTTSTITNLPPMLLFFGNTFTIGGTEITYGSVLMLILYVIAWFVLRSTPAGRSVYAVGDNPEAARLAGINTNRVLIGVYTMAALTYGIAGLLLVSRTGVGDPQAGQTSNLDSITAVVLGGTSLLGGRGQIMGTLIGALIVGRVPQRPAADGGRVDLPGADHRYPGDRGGVGRLPLPPGQVARQEGCAMSCHPRVKSCWK